MAGRTSRNKGARGEREVVTLLQEIVDEVYAEENRKREEWRSLHGRDMVGENLAVPVLKRNYSQRFAAKQYDVEGLDWLALEVKRVENLSGLGSWWTQCRTATRKGQTSVLFYRQNHGRWKIRMRVWVRAGVPIADRQGYHGKSTHVGMTVDTDIDSFLVWFRERLKSEL